MDVPSKYTYEWIVKKVSRFSPLPIEVLEAISKFYPRRELEFDVLRGMKEYREKRKKRIERIKEELEKVLGTEIVLFYPCNMNMGRDVCGFCYKISLRCKRSEYLDNHIITVLGETKIPPHIVISEIGDFYFIPKYPIKSNEDRELVEKTRRFLNKRGFIEIDIEDAMLLLVHMKKRDIYTDFVHGFWDPQEVPLQERYPMVYDALFYKD